mmetsp:Transcript_1774/g.2453  ORF Transcript_1774/g.2453 Transcript_1774/m.2453 type:complete len:229 (+) Transcript_1774:822-1508(+)
MSFTTMQLICGVSDVCWLDCFYASNHSFEGELPWMGVVLLTGSDQYFFFISCSKDNLDQLGKIVSVLGTSDFLSYCKKCNLDITSDMRKTIAKYTFRNSDLNGGRRKAWTELLKEDCPMPSREGLDLLNKLLVYDHEIRWTAKEAMGHKFFDEVREAVEGEVELQMRRLRREKAENEGSSPVSDFQNFSVEQRNTKEDVVQPPKQVKRLLSKLLKDRSKSDRKAGTRP